MSERVNDEPLGLPVARVAARLGCHKDHVYRLLRDGYLDAFPGPGLKLVTVASWRRYLASAGVDDGIAS